MENIPKLTSLDLPVLFSGLELGSFAGNGGGFSKLIDFAVGLPSVSFSSGYKKNKSKVKKNSFYYSISMSLVEIF